MDCPEWKGPGAVIGQDGAVVFVTHGGTCARVHYCRLKRVNTVNVDHVTKDTDTDTDLDQGQDVTDSHLGGSEDTVTEEQPGQSQTEGQQQSTRIITGRKRAT